jgi:hypothetical protein
LTKVLTYHVVAGRVLRADVPLGTPITTLQGETFTVDATLTIADQCGWRWAGPGPRPSSAPTCGPPAS